MSKIAVIGTGYVGLVTGACLSEFGHSVICVDIDENKIETLKKGIIPIYEPGLQDLVTKNYYAGRLDFTTHYSMAVDVSDVVFIAVGTPPQDDGSADLDYVLAAARKIAENMNCYKVIVNKSTVPVGTGKLVKQTIKEVLEKRKLNIDYDVVSNPEFLREGAAVNDFMHPERIVIGSDHVKAEEIMRDVYRVLYLNNHPFVLTNIETAEIIKYASNAFLATKITFINEISRLCEAAGGNVQHVSRAMGLDKRIGKFFLHAGPGYGGSCFPKDTKALVHIGREFGVDISIVDAVIIANQSQKLRMVEKIITKMGDIQGKRIAVLGLAFKPGTDDMREAPSITIIHELHKRGARLSVYDPIAMENAKKVAFLNLDLDYAENEYAAIADAQAVVLLTEWNQFRSMDLAKMKSKMNGNYFFDFRNIYDRNELETIGFIYDGVGK
ncbi:UDP-glucose dehydrogenase family protein [Dehalobacter restrictus]|uniref:UDP-glucose 6-dehydrogenase n=1 Tax=Dehalobacter restrictus TaxID=55583 RepID=A0A857DJF3_9FIRM|nr:UDP-glucose/GDP-mannose dehydrogenase family protein [Dehalobacter restrictus]QHA00933.1 nucleotide sugar dehydrogenase [Dehalobacter restrictus]